MDVRVSVEGNEADSLADAIGGVLGELDQRGRATLPPTEDASRPDGSGRDSEDAGICRVPE